MSYQQEIACMGYFLLARLVEQCEFTKNAPARVLYMVLRYRN